jgi:hypothetical protein
MASKKSTLNVFMRGHRKTMTKKHAQKYKDPCVLHVSDKCIEGKLPEYLQIEGNCSVELNNMDIGDGLNLFGQKESDNVLLTKENVNHVVIGAWLHGKGEMAVCRCSKTNGKFSLKVKVDEYSTDVLKIGIYLDMIDPETSERKLFPMQTCGVHLSKLVTSDIHEICNDEFNEGLSSKLVISCPQKNFPVGSLQKSCISQINEYNDTLIKMSETVVQHIHENGMRAPKPAEGFLKGITYLPFCGIPSEGIPPLCGHYVMFGAMINHLERVYPMAVPVYCFMFAVSHGKYTMDEILQLHEKGTGDSNYIHLVAEIITGFTKDAGCIPYQRDGTPTMGLFRTPTTIEMGVTVQTTEDIGIVGTTQTFMVEGEDVKYDQIVASGNVPQFDPRMSMDAILKEIFREEWPTVSRAWGKDDCESTAFMACLIFNTIMKTTWTVDNMRKELASFACFSKLTDTCYEKMCTVFTGIQNRYEQGLLHVGTVIGLAGGASADNVEEGDVDIDNNTGAGGHCFGVLKGFDADNGNVITEIIEGTNSVNMIEAHLSEQEITIAMPPGKNMKNLKYPASRIASEISMFIGNRLQIGKVLLGSTLDPGTAGISGTYDLESHCRSQLAMNREQPGFYMWAMGVGTSYSPKTFGHIPCGRQLIPGAHGVNDKNPLLNTLAGCAPSCLCKRDLLGYNLHEDVFPKETFEIGMSVVNEIYPPVAPTSEFARVMRHWVPCEPLDTLNVDFAEKRMEGVEYIPVNTMESPGCPLLMEGYYLLKKKVVDVYNQLSKDGSYMRVRKLGTGIVVTYYMPVTDKPLDLAICLQAAMEKAGWPHTQPVQVSKKTNTAC